MSQEPLRYRIADLPEDARPREKLLRQGAAALSTEELLAIMLRTGSTDDSALVLADKIFGAFGKDLRRLAQASQQELKQIKGIGDAKVAQMLGALELGRRLYEAQRQAKATIRTPADAADYVMAEMRYLDRENLRVLCLDSKNRVLCDTLVSVGTVNASLAHPRECFKEAIRRSAAAVIVVHNHPSGDPTPSSEDVQLTKQLNEAARLLGIDLLDHVVIGDGEWMSLKEKGLM